MAKKSFSRRYNIPVFLFLMVFAVVMLFPFAWMILSAFKTSAEVLAYPLVWLPSSFKLDNFRKVFDMVPFGTYYMNTIITSIAQTLIQIAMSVCAAYAFAKLKFPFKRTIYMLVQSAMFVPMSVLVVPIYQMISRSGLTDTYAGIILPQVLGVFTTMMLISFFQTIPDDLMDAAKIDGCGYFKILWHVIIVNSVTAIATALLYAFLSHWRSYMWPLLVTNKTEMRTVAVGLKYLISETSSAYQVMMAGALMSIIPLLVVYLLCEKHFVRSMTMTGLKG